MAGTIMSKGKPSSEALTKFLQHPNKDEIIQKLILGISIEDINEWLVALYQNNKELVISKKFLSEFKDNHLDLYVTLKEDAHKFYSKQLNPEEEVQLTLNNNKEYERKLQKYLDNELDIKSMLVKMIARVEYLAEQRFEQMQGDIRNTKMDRNFLEFMNTLLTICEKFEPIIQGPQNQINIQNNFNISLLDQRLGMISETVREIISEFDQETALLFIDRYSEKMAALKETMEPILPPEKRLEAVQVLATDIQDKLSAP